jgi:hypothetical protein
MLWILKSQKEDEGGRQSLQKNGAPLGCRCVPFQTLQRK